MTEKNFYIMLVNAPWGGPTGQLVSGPAINTNRGRSVGALDQPFIITLSVDKQADNPSEFPPCDIHETPSHLIFSRKFINILQALGVNNIEYLDARVTYEPTGEELDYKVANIEGVVSGLDRDKSDIATSPRGTVIEIRKMCLDEQSLANNPISRLQESIMLVVVHKDIKEAVEAANLSGFLFVTDDEYRPGMI